MYYVYLLVNEYNQALVNLLIKVGAGLKDPGRLPGR
jgi:hypothetical protein